MDELGASLALQNCPPPRRETHKPVAKITLIGRESRPMSARHTIIKQARDNGELVYDFNQRHTPQYKRSPRDFCAGLSIQWLALHLAGKDYAYDTAKKLLDDPGDEPLDVQDVYEKQGHLKAFEKVGLKRKDKETTVPGAVQAGQLVAAASEAGLYFLRIRHDEDSGHAVAFQCQKASGDLSFLYFDGNLGTFSLASSKRFQTWFDDVIGRPLLEGGDTYQSHYAHKWILYRLVAKS